ncbi:hypothetical protein E2562_036645 [Oryza meyeriana var. granulata]|uniref:Uncharacterized protein n=1 Tax=Oryza meyeriana var. granulata TaxID=110450 RepID=A0A6G1DB48_9ORYZ|nr:hypothetical protein E2562_036645 [Oryza meyeriana var. granulata]
MWQALESRLQLSLAEASHQRWTSAAQLEELAMARATRAELQRTAASNVSTMRYYHCRALGRPRAVRS